MSDFQATSSQKQAIETRGSTVLVSAGAGSGKTKVLTERLMSRLRDEEQPGDLDRFLIITFTRAAAAELRGRIMEELSQALAEDPGNRRLRRQSALCRRASIGTIHSFCTSILREFSQQAGISPDFRILEENRAGTMMAAALDRVLERSYDRLEERPDFRLLADTVGAGRDDRRLAALVLNLYEKMQCHARPEDWAEQQVALLDAPAKDVSETLWGRALLENYRETAAFWAEEMDRSVREMQGAEKIRMAYADSFAATADALRELSRCLELGWDKACALFPLPFPRLGKLRESPDPALSDRVKARREACKKEAEKLQRDMDRSSEALLAELSKTAPAMKALLRLVLEFREEYAKAKRRAGVADYGDLEHLCAELLIQKDGSPTELAQQIAGRYDEVMVDEYQDVSRVQDAIFHAVSGEGKRLFLVGDVKQAIYRFRLADPEIFNEKYRAYADWEQADPGAPRRILLRENFRSRKEIIDGANGVFSRIMSRGLGDIDYDEAAALRFGATGYQGAVPLPELMLLDRKAAGGDEESPDAQAAEAAMVAGKIRELMDAGIRVTDRGTERPLRYGDIAILLRSANTVGGVYRRELSRQGVPVAAGQGGGFFTSVEISALISMLALIDDPHQDVPLIAALRSPAFGFAADELSAIRAADPEKDLFTALKAYAAHDRKTASFLTLLERLRTEAPDLHAAELVERILTELDLMAVCGAMSEPLQRQSRILALVDLAESFESSGYRGLHRFVLWLRQLAQRGQEPPLGGGSDTAVQILSVHRSKGLEFPVVFLCDTARKFNMSDGKETVLIHPELGLGPKLTDPERHVELPTLARNAIRLRLRNETLSEEMRLLYVALTRARERLFVTGAVKDPEKQIEKLSAALGGDITTELLRQQSAPIFWILGAVLADGEKHWHLSIHGSREDGENQELPGENEKADPAAEAALRERLSFEYPYRGAEDLPSKVTATELKGRGETDPEAGQLAPRRHRPFRTADFGRAERPVTGAEKGTATHLLLQLMDLSGTVDEERIEAEIQRLRQRNLLSEREKDAVDVNAVLKLFRSPLGQRMLRSGTLRREFKFSLLCPAKDYFPGGGDEQVLLQGVVDCFFEENGRLVVVDYKTDRLRSRAEAETRAAYYAGQLWAYAGALRRITGKPVAECLLYFLSLGETVAVDPGET